MPRCHPAVFCLAALCLSAPPAGAADDAYDLRGPAPAKGLAFVTTSTFAMKDADVTISLGGNKLEGKMDMTSASVKEEEVLGVDGRDITKLRTKILKEEVKTKATIGGMTQDKAEKKDLAGEIVFSEKTKNGWKHVLEDAKPTEKQAKALKNFDDPENEDELYPAEKVKVGHAWEVKAEALKRVLGAKASDVTGKAKSKFLRVEEFGGEKCAVIETEIDLKATVKEDDNDMKVQMKGKIVNIRSIKDGLDRKYTIEGTATFSGKVKEDCQEADIHFSGKMSGEGASKFKAK